MHFRQMSWVRQQVPVCVFEEPRKGLFRSHVRVIFLGRLAVLPVLFCRREWIFRDISDQGRLRSTMMSELKRIMSAANLDETYRIVDWFMRKGRLFVHVAANARELRRSSDSLWKRVASWLRWLMPES
jgi:hypothetical protein